MRRRRWILIVLILILLSVIVFMPSYGWKLRQWLSPSNVDNGNNGGDAENPGLAAENDELKAEVATYAAIAAQLPQAPKNEIRGLVYSRYPFNFKNELLVNAGSLDGVAIGSAVTYQKLLIGKVAAIFPHEALVETIFDSEFKLPVRIGSASYDGLFEGGAYPKVGSIAKSAMLKSGDIVYAAAPGLPYGMPIGEVNVTSTSNDSLFTEAAMSFPYDINEVQTVLIAEPQ